MEKRVMLLQALISLFLSMSLETSTGNQLFSSLQFTRDTLMGFSRGSERTVEILTPKKETKTLTVPPATVSKTKVKFTLHKGVEGDKGIEGERYGVMKAGVEIHLSSKETEYAAVLPLPRPKATQRPVTQTVISYQKKRKTYRPRTSPSNKFLEAINGIERAVANARASGVRYSEATLAKLKRLLVTAITRKSYKYAREVLGQVMYLLSVKTSPTGRKKRSSQNEGGKFLQGLRQQVGSSTFDSFMAVQGDVSLMFVIDDTGSMGNEIQATKNIAIDIINYPRQAPVEYILSPFNDPYPDESPVIFKDEIDAGEFVQAINDLTPRGGGDCPEYAFTGMLEALYQDPQWGSPMYVFTDAGPKDATDEFIEEVKYLASAEEYGVTINFFTTGFCRSQGYAGGDPRNLHPAFKELAELTSGQAILLKDHWELEKLDGLTGGVLEGTNVISMGSNMSGRKKRSVGGAADSRYNIPVDESIEKLLVTVSTTKLDTRGHGITLSDPDDVIITSGKLSLSQISVYQIDNPKKGAWTLVVSGSNGGHEFFVKSTSETNLDFEHYFLISLRGRRGVSTEVPISNPVIGKLNKMVLTVAGSEKIDTSSVRLELITTEGARISDVTLQKLNDVHFTVGITPSSSQPFKLRIRGTTRGGNSFERISRQTIKPTTFVLRGKYASNDYTLPLGAVTFVHFQLCNFGASFCRSQGYAGGDPRNLHPAFKELAELTSGQAILLKDHWELEKLDGLTGGVLEGTNVISMGSNMSGRKKRSVGGAADSRYNIPVDESIEKLLVTVSTTKLDTRGHGITLSDPDDVIITSGKLSLSQISVYQIDNPKKGAWTLVVSGSNGGHEFFVKSTSETNLDFEHYFLISLRGRRGVSTEVPISNPVIGKLNKMVLTVAGSEKIDTSSVRLELITTEGARISDVTLQKLNDVHFTVGITPSSSQPFKLRIRGTTRGGNSFERISRQTIKPTTFVLRGKYASNDYTLPLGAVTFVHFQLCNFGASEYFDVTVVKDKLGYVLSPNIRPRRVTKGRCTTLSIRARATRSQDVDKTDTVFIIAKGRTSKSVVSQAVRLFVVPAAN